MIIYISNLKESIEKALKLINSMISLHEITI